MTTSNDNKVNEVLSNLGHKFPIEGINAAYFAGLLNKYNKSNNTDIKYIEASVDYSEEGFDKGESFPISISLDINKAKAEIKLYGDEYGTAEDAKATDEYYIQKNVSQEKLDFSRGVISSLNTKIEEYFKKIEEFNENLDDDDYFDAEDEFDLNKLADDMMKIVMDYCKENDVLLLTDYDF